MTQGGASSSTSIQNPSPPPSPSLYHPAFGGLVRHTAAPQPADDEQATSRTIALMSRYALEDSRHEIVRRAAWRAVGQARTPKEIAGAVFAFVKRSVRFVEDEELARPLAGLYDPRGVELLIRPVDLLTMPAPAGDCDDFSMLTAALLLAVGIEPVYRTVAADAAAPASYSHVYVVARIGGGELALDTSHGPAPGWEAPAAGKSRDWRIADMPHLGAIDWSKLIQTGVEAGAKIATARYGQPPAGVVFTQGADGSTYYRQPAGAGPFTFPGASLNFPGGSSYGGLLLLAAVAVVLVLALRSR